MYAGLQRHTFSQMLTGLEFVRDWVTDVEPHYLSAEKANFLFVTRWCLTIKRILKEFSPLIIDQPGQIHYLSLAVAFSAFELDTMYETHGNVDKREPSSRFKISRPGRQTRKDVARHRRSLGGDRGQERVLLFIYDPIRDVYIWVWSGWVRNEAINLCIQSASSGKRLIPVIYPVNGFGHIRGYALSKDGKHLAFNLCGGCDPVVVIWQIQQPPDFTNRSGSADWAVLIFQSKFSGPYDHRAGVAFNEKGYCCTPVGLVDPTTKGIVSASCPNESLRRLPENEEGLIAFSGDGRFLFLLFRKRIQKFTFPDMGFVTEVSLRKDFPFIGYSGAFMSPKGRYVLIHDSLSQTPAPLALLVDTVNGNQTELPEPAHIHSWDPHFSSDEREIIRIFTVWESEIRFLEIWFYTGLADQIQSNPAGKLRHQGHFTAQPYLSDDHVMAMLLLQSGEIQRLRLGPEVEFWDAADRIDESSDEHYDQYTFISHDANKFAHLHFSKKKAYLQIFEPVDPIRSIRRLELKKMVMSRYSARTMNSDLTILIIGTAIYNVGDWNDQNTSTPVMTIDVPIGHVIDSRISLTATYLAFIGSRQCCDGPEISDPCPRLTVFRLDDEISSATKIDLLLPEHMNSISLGFHPSRPLLVLGYNLFPNEPVSQLDSPKTVSENNILKHHGFLKEKYSWHVMIINLETMISQSLHPINSPTADLSPVSFEEGLITVYHNSEPYLRRNVSDLVATPSPTRRYLMFDYSCSGLIDEVWKSLIFDDKCYFLSLDSGSHKVKLETRLLNDIGLVKNSKIPSKSIILFSTVSELHGFRDSIVLLLGKNDAEPLRLLLTFSREGFAEIKTLPFTWTQARAKLDQLWESAYGATDRRKHR